MKKNHKLKEKFLLRKRHENTFGKFSPIINFIFKPLLKDSFAIVYTNNGKCEVYLPTHWEKSKNIRSFERELKDTMLHESLHYSLHLCNRNPGSEEQITTLMKEITRK